MPKEVQESYHAKTTDFNNCSFDGSGLWNC